MNLISFCYWCLLQICSSTIVTKICSIGKFVSVSGGEFHPALRANGEEFSQMAENPLPKLGDLPSQGSFPQKMNILREILLDSSREFSEFLCCQFSGGELPDSISAKR
jgi:hypothetical protein